MWLFWIGPWLYSKKENYNIVCKYLGEVRPKYLLFGWCSLNSQSRVILQSGALTQKLYLQWILIISPKASQNSGERFCYWVKFTNILLNKSIGDIVLFHLKNVSFSYNKFWKFWLVFEYFLKPGINIRNIWLTRPQNSPQTAGTKFCQIFKCGGTDFVIAKFIDCGLSRDLLESAELKQTA